MVHRRVTAPPGVLTQTLDQLTTLKPGIPDFSFHELLSNYSSFKLNPFFWGVGGGGDSALSSVELRFDKVPGMRDENLHL